MAGWGTPDWVGQSGRRRAGSGLGGNIPWWVGKVGAPAPAAAAPAGPTTGGGDPATRGATPEASDPRESALDVMRKFFASIGLDVDAELEGVLRTAMVDGYGPDQIDLIMPDLMKTQAFTKRFPGYAQRLSNGFNAISIGDYIRLEDQYHSIMKSAGLPAGFYDDHSDFGQWIANDVSPAEIQTRVNLATDAAKSIDPTMRTLMSRFYGLSTGDVASYFLDPNRALPVVEHQYKTAGVASWAARNGYEVNDMSRYEQLVADGVTADQAAQAYGTVKSLDETVGRAASVYGENFTQDDAEQDVFFNKSDKRRKIMAQEQATFGGTSGGATGSAKRQSY